MTRGLGVSSDNPTLITGKIFGKAFWAYVQVEPLKRPLFERALAENSSDYARYGEELARGWGFAPPESIRAQYE